MESPREMASPGSEFRMTSTPSPRVMATISSGEGHGARIHDVRDAQGAQPLAFLRGSGGSEDFGAGGTAELNGGQADAAGGGVDQNALAGLDASQVMEPMLYGSECRQQAPGIVQASQAGL